MIGQRYKNNRNKIESRGIIRRGAVSGQTATPPLFQMMAVLGKERTLARIDDAIKRLAGM
jgi:glutamyl/glutaminyl-tRNA synthetase